MKWQIRAVATALILTFGLPVPRSTMAYGQPPPGARRSFPPPPTEAERERARQQIGISVAQQAQLEHLYAEADQKKRDVSEQMGQLYTEHRTLSESYTYDWTRERILRRKIMGLHNRMLQIHVETEQGLRRILNRDQFDRLRAVINAQRQARRNGRNRNPDDRNNGRTDSRPDRSFHP